MIGRLRIITEFCQAVWLATAMSGLPWIAAAQDGFGFSGQIDFGARIHTDDGLFAGQSTAGGHFFLGAELNAYSGLGAGDLTFQITALSDDKGGRSQVKVRKAYYAQVFDNWDLLIGYNIENWGVAESRSILNVINPVSASDLSYGQDLPGTPMINANFQTSLGTLSAFALIGFEQPQSTGRSERHRALWGTNNARAVYQEGNGRNFDVALRFAGNYSLGGGSLDLAASYFNGTSRTPLALPGCGYASAAAPEPTCAAINSAIVGAFESGIPAATDSGAIWDFLTANASDAIMAAASAIPSAGFIPYYQKIQHMGFSAVYARGDLQLRFEGAWQQAKGEEAGFSAVVGGDYTWPGFAGGDGTLTVALEYLYDDRNSRQPASIFENDVFLGFNYSLNDTRDTRLSAGGFYDLDSHARLYQMSLSARVNDSIRAEISAVHVRTIGWNDPLAFLRNDDFIELKFSVFF